MLNVSDKWKDYEIIATGDGEKIERFGDVILRRPDPQVIWDKSGSNLWNNFDGIYHRSSSGGGYWEFKKRLPDYWVINYGKLKFKIAPTNFKHTGIFPEQAVNWDYIIDKISNSNKDMRVLNLFAYTGCATMAASFAGAKEVVHVDSSKGINEWAKDNMNLCGLENNTIRFIVDDAIKFLEKEIRRGRKYHAVIMDPPSYGRGPNKEVWKFEDNLKILLNLVKQVLDDDYEFLLINSYTTGVSHISLNNILSLVFSDSNIVTGEIGLPIKENNLILPCGIYGKVTKN